MDETLGIVAVNDPPEKGKRRRRCLGMESRVPLLATIMINVPIGLRCSLHREEKMALSSAMVFDPLAGKS